MEIIDVKINNTNSVGFYVITSNHKLLYMQSNIAFYFLH